MFAFPPWSLIPQVLKKLRSSSGVLMTLAAPWWPQRPLFPELLDLMIDSPVHLPQSRDLLRQPHFHRHHLGISRLSLHAWRLSNDLPNHKDFHVQPSRLALLIVLHLVRATNLNGRYIDNGVIQRAIRSLVLLSLRLRIFSFGSEDLGSFLYTQFWATVPCLLRYSVLNCLESQPHLCYMISYVPLR